MLGAEFFYCNTLTGTNFKNSEFGAIYTESRYADSNPNDAIGDAGNNKTEEVDARGNVTRYEYDPVTSKPTVMGTMLNNTLPVRTMRFERHKLISILI
jgi:hypothetical protein